MDEYFLCNGYTTTEWIPIDSIEVDINILVGHKRTHKKTDEQISVSEKTSRVISFQEKLL
jgi:hypothetical protein